MCQGLILALHFMSIIQLDKQTDRVVVFMRGRGSLELQSGELESEVSWGVILIIARE